MAPVTETRTDELLDLFWRDELTEAMWWLTSERQAPHVDLHSLEQVLWSGAAVEGRWLQGLVDAGLARPASPASYVLTALGRARGAALLRAEARESVRPEAVCGSDDSSASCCGPAAAGDDCGCCGGGRDAGLGWPS